MDNVRQLFMDVMNYKKVDRMPVMHWTGWTETIARWEAEGMPKGVDQNKYFDTPPLQYRLPINNHLYPAFDEETIEETPEYRIFRQGDGVIAQHWKNKSCIPHFIDFTIKGSEGKGWDEYKKRLQPHPGRIPKELDEKIKNAARDANSPVMVSTGSMIGWIRDWVGVENLAYIAFDNRELLREMVTTIADLVIWGIDEIGKRGAKIDIGWAWEDICFKTGPLVSPEIWEDVAVPNYRRIWDTLLKYGCSLHAVDCDGHIDALVPGWLEGGVNVMFPIEIGTWKADSAVYRKKYGKNLRIFGGIDKLEIEKGPAAIDAEIKKRIPLMKEGGFVPLPDHLITPGTSLSNYKYYLKQMKALRF